jgi:flagella basal body P-ring formation protein FlgA
MNSRCGRFVQQFIPFLLSLSFFVTNGYADLIHSDDLQHQIKQRVLDQWQSLEQRQDVSSKVKIIGLPAGYTSPKCPQKLEVKANKQLTLGRNSIEVSCPNTSSWSLMLTANIEVWRNVVVIQDHLARGERIQSDSLTLQQRNIGGLQRGYFTNLNEVFGQVSKRSLKAGTVLNPSMIDLPIIIQRGQLVTLRVEHPGLTVNMKATALKKGRKGDLIKVKNNSSNRVLFGTVVHADLVLVN